MAPFPRTTGPNFRALGELVADAADAAARAQPRSRAVPAPAAAVDERPRLAHAAVEVLDARAWDDLDPVQPTRAVLYVSGTSPLDIALDGAVCARFTPTDSAPAAGDYQLALAVYEALVAQHGHDDAGEDAGGRYDAEGAAAMRPAVDLARAVAGDRLRNAVRGECEQLLRQAEAIGRHHGMAPEAIARVTGRAFVPRRRTMLEPMARARVLDEQAAQAEVARQEAARAAAAAAAEAARPRTLRELGTVAVAVRRDRIGLAVPAPLPGLFGHTVTTTEPWTGAHRLWATDSEDVFGHLVVPGVLLPAFNRDSVRRLSPDELVPPGAQRAREPTVPALAFWRERAVERGADYGPVDPATLTTDVPEQARDFVREHAKHLLVEGATEGMFRGQWLLEMLTRGFRLRPEIALDRVLLPELDLLFRSRRPPTRVPVNQRKVTTADGNETELHDLKEVPMYGDNELPSRNMRRGLGTALAEALERGTYIAGGATLDAYALDDTPAASATVSPGDATALATSAKAAKKSSSK